MNIRETITYAIDHHGRELRLSRSQLAHEAKVNPGQVSNWLKNDGAMGYGKKGLLAELVLGRVEEYLQEHPDAGNARTLRTYRDCLTSFGPRLRMTTALPETALTGGPISRENPLYVQRNSDVDLEDRLKGDVIRIAVSGGPKTGKSSLLWAAEELLESGRSVVRVDFAHFTPPQPRVEVRDLFRWIQMKGEDQIGGPCPAVLEGPTQLPNWVSSNLLPNALNGKCVMIFDNVENLFRESGQTGEQDCHLVHAFQGAISGLSYRTDANLRRLGVICAFDPFDKAFQGYHERPFTELSFIPTYPPLQLNDVDRLMVQHGTVYGENDQRQQILAASGGHPFVTQVLCKAASESGGSFAEALERARTVLAKSVQSRWSADWLAFATRACAPESEAFPINARGVVDFIYSGVASHETTSNGDIKFSPAVRGQR